MVAVVVVALGTMYFDKECNYEYGAVLDKRPAAFESCSFRYF